MQPYQIKQLRITLYALGRYITDNQFRKTRETALAFTAIQRARMWAGRLLGECGEPTPYPASDDPNSPVIEPQADTGNEEGDLPWPVKDDHVDNVKTARLVLAGQLDYIPPHIANMFSGREMLVSLNDAKMWLGQELDRFRRSGEPVSNAEKKAVRFVVGGIIAEAPTTDLLKLGFEGGPESKASKKSSKPTAP